MVAVCPGGLRVVVPVFVVPSSLVETVLALRGRKSGREAFAVMRGCAPDDPMPLSDTVTVADGAVTVFIGVDHCTLEGIGIHAAKRATRFEALEPIRQGVRQQFGAVSAGIATGVQVRHDHGSQYMSDDFQAELRFLGITSSPAFVRAPEGNGVAERFIRTLKEQLLCCLLYTSPSPRDRTRSRMPSSA